MEKISIIDIGTKSLKHYIFNLSGKNKELLSYKRYSEVNLGIDSNISNETEERLFSVIKNCLDINKSMGVEKIKMTGTEIFRRSNQAKDIANKIKEITSINIEILDHEKEAFYLYKGFVDLIENQIDFSAVNVGGGSTEIVYGDNKNIKYSQKLPFGVNFLRNNFSNENTIDWAGLDEYLEKNISSYEKKVDDLFITGVLDFLQTISPQTRFKFRENGTPHHPIYLNIKEYNEMVKWLRKTPVETLRKLYVKDPDFADNIAIGQSVYLKVAQKLGSSRIIPSNNDLTDGIINEIK